MALGRLQKVPLREAWKHEALDFTNWLALPENLALLGEELQIDLILKQTEASVGRFSVDILAEEDITSRRVIIENQLESTDHDHLGKLITYASGHDAEIIIWIVKDVRDEHKQAVDWLNEHTDEELNFFVVRMELWQISGSPFAPKFHIVCQPNNWAKAIKHGTNQSGTMTDLRVRNLEFWTRFREYGEERSGSIRFRKAHPHHWYDISFGSTAAHVALTIKSQTLELGCEIYINDSKELFRWLHQHREEVENKLEDELEWQELPHRKASRIRLRVQRDFTQPESWDDCFSWLLAKTERFQNVFAPLISEFSSIRSS